MYFKMSIRPNQAMLKQAERLKSLIFEIHNPLTILQQQYFYAFTDLNENTEKEEKFKAGCCGTEMDNKVWKRYRSNRWWHMMCSSIPLFLCAVLGLCSGLYELKTSDYYCMILLSFISVIN